MNREQSAELLRVAERMVWFKVPAETLADPVLFLSHVMTCGTVDDLRVVRAHFTDDQLRQALRAGLPGVFDARSWAYWHAVLGVDPVPPLPARRLPAPEMLRQLGASAHSPAPSAAPGFADKRRGGPKPDHR